MRRWTKLQKEAKTVNGIILAFSFIRKTQMDSEQKCGEGGRSNTMWHKAKKKEKRTDRIKKIKH